MHHQRVGVVTAHLQQSAAGSHPTSATWNQLPTAGCVVERKYHVFAATEDGRCAYTFGGLKAGGSGDDREGSCAGSVHRLAVATGEWSVVHSGQGSSAPSPRNEPCGAIIGHTLWIFGGSLEAPPNVEPETSAELWRFDLRDHVWEQCHACGGPSARCAAAACTDGQRLYIYGGGGKIMGQSIFQQPGVDWARRTDAFAFDPVTQTWEELTVAAPESKMPIGRSLPQIAAPSGHGSLYLFGGFSEGDRLNDTWIMSGMDKPASRAWREVTIPVAGRPNARSCHGSGVLHSNAGPFWVVVGGRIGKGARQFGDGFVDTKDVDDVWLFDFATEQWKQVSVTAAAAGPGEQRSHGIAVVAEDRLLLHGGRSETHPVLGTTYELQMPAT
eukprot:SAG31_NODE_302_length_18087_cov_97.056982_8_plen_385_part_00